MELFCVFVVADWEKSANRDWILSLAMNMGRCVTE
jgi:hypothetical protein